MESNDEKVTKLKVLIDYISELVENKYIVKSEYSTDYRDTEVIVVQEQDGTKTVFYGNIDPLYDYFEINIFADSIREAKNTANLLGKLIGQMIFRNYQVTENNQNFQDKWEIIFSQYANPQTINYQDIRRVSYSLTLQCIISKIYRKEIEENGK